MKNNKIFIKFINNGRINKKLFIIIIIFLSNYINKSLIFKIIIKDNTLKNSKNLGSNNETIINDNKYNISNYTDLIKKLNLFSNQTKKTNIIFTDLYESKSCFDKNAYILFEYFLNNNLYIPFYIINNESDFYKSLKKQNKTKNLILFNEKKDDFLEDLYKYLKDTTIVVTSYSLRLLQIVASFVPFIKFLKINHGIKYFKFLTAKRDIIKSLENKANVICSSPFEYQLLTKRLNYSKNQIHNASIVRYERFQFIKKNDSEKKCILISFTYRSYNRFIFEKSKYKKNLEKLLNDNELIKYLNNKNIDLIYIPHHEEIDLGKNYSQHIFNYAKIKSQSNLEYYIDQCSLLVTDFSSICFDFMFQNKPVLYYGIDKNEKFYYVGKKFIHPPNDILYFGNYFSSKSLLIDKIKYYINNSFELGKELKKKYESVFFLKKNIVSKIVEIINNIIKNKMI